MSIRDYLDGIFDAISKQFPHTTSQMTMADVGSLFMAAQEYAGQHKDLPRTPSNAEQFTTWKDRPDSDGLWWVVDRKKVKLLQVDILTRLAHEMVCEEDQSGITSRHFTGPWLKVTVPEMPK